MATDLRPALAPAREYVLPAGYSSRLSLRQTERAIKFIKDYFERALARALNLTRVTAPFLVPAGTGLNDQLSGVEQPVRFVAGSLGGEVEIVQSLAKWKRLALAEYGFAVGEGLYTDMNAIRPDEQLDNLHSLYVDQWDWERVISAEDRTIPFLQQIVRHIYATLVETERATCAAYPSLDEPFLPPAIHFVHSEDLQRLYPHLPPRQREDAVCREYGAAFIIGIGAPLSDGHPHDSRAADYDDWSTPTGDGHRGLNGDILVWYPTLQCAFELSSMGIRVSPASLEVQLTLKGEEHKRNLPFHRRLLADEFPLTIGGGIGQSRLCMLFLRKAHIGEVQSCVWPEAMRRACREQGAVLL